MPVKKRITSSRSGLTLLELLIILAIAAVLFFIALPTLRPTQEEATIEFAKEQLRYLAAREEAYFLRYGTYAPLKKISEDETLGRDFDQRFAADVPNIDGIAFTGPQNESKVFDIVAKLPDGTSYVVDQTGEVRALQ